MKELEKKVKPGITTKELDKLAEELVLKTKLILVQLLALLKWMVNTHSVVY
jgi:methionine aminopeptidase